MLIRKGQKGGIPCPWLWSQASSIYTCFTADILCSTEKDQLYLFKYSFRIYCGQGNEQGSGRRVSQKNNFGFTSWPTLEVSSRLRDQVNKTGEETTEVHKRGSKKLTFMFFYKAHLILNFYLYLIEMQRQMPTQIITKKSQRTKEKKQKRKKVSTH